MRQNRARSLLVSTPRRVLLENNLFSSMMAGVLISGDANFWYESGPVTDVVIRNNTFLNCCTSGHDQVPLLITPNIMDIKQSQGCLHRNILVEGNTFHVFDSRVVEMISACQVRILNNKIIQNQDFPAFFPHGSALKFTHCQVDAIRGNAYSGTGQAEVVMDAKTRLSEFDNNAGFDSEIKKETVNQTPLRF
ncbi:MAG: hypothetical protein HC842_03145 [Cytophagales bacterium]|nr:hypothetical protein [Cytophagales bacterium]